MRDEILKTLRRLGPVPYIRLLDEARPGWTMEDEAIFQRELRSLCQSGVVEADAGWYRMPDAA